MSGKSCRTQYETRLKWGRLQEPSESHTETLCALYIFPEFILYPKPHLRPNSYCLAYSAVVLVLF